MGEKHTDKTTQKDEPADKLGPSSSLPKHLAETAWRVAVPFLLFSLGGILLDSQLDTSPLFSLIGLAVALFAVYAVVRRYVEANFPETFNKDKKDKRDK